ncbi:MAG: hypothetical protein IPP66_02435 [Anaerolineales bacterium]|nr:hypothetical protein [Anaerolineales bacterium]
MRQLERWIGFIQIVASIGLGASCFLPFYRSAADKIQYADEWGFFFWAIPVSLLIFKLSVRWLKVTLCILSIIGGLLDLLLLTFLATFKSTPLLGFSLAKASIIILVTSWFAICVVSLLTFKRKQTEN